MFGFKRRHAELMWSLQEANLRATSLHNDHVYHHALTHECLRHVLTTLHRIEEHMATRQQITDTANRLLAACNTFSNAVDVKVAAEVAKATNLDDPQLDAPNSAMTAMAERLEAATAQMTAPAAAA